MTPTRAFGLATVMMCFILTGCAPSSPAPQIIPTSSDPRPRPSPKPSVSDRLIVTVDGLTFEHAGARETVRYRDGKALLALLATATGTKPITSEIEDLPGYEFNMTAYKWSGLSVVASDDFSNASVSVTSSTLNGIQVQTDEGITVGSSRAEVIAARGRTLIATNKVSDADEFALNSREFPGVNSLSRPGFTGTEFILAMLSGNTVQKLHCPANDFSDI